MSFLGVPSGFVVSKTSRPRKPVTSASIPRRVVQTASIASRVRSGRGRIASSTFTRGRSGIAPTAITANWQAGPSTANRSHSMSRIGRKAWAKPSRTAG